MKARTRLAVFALALVSVNCGLVGPSCLDRRESGLVATVNGDVAPGQMAVHLMPYDTRGSQNDARITWANQTTTGPRVRMYATRASCTSFHLSFPRTRGPVPRSALLVGVRPVSRPH